MRRPRQVRDLAVGRIHAAAVVALLHHLCCLGALHPGKCFSERDSERVADSESSALYVEACRWGAGALCLNRGPSGFQGTSVTHRNILHLLPFACCRCKIDDNSTGSILRMRIFTRVDYQREQYQYGLEHHARSLTKQHRGGRWHSSSSTGYGVNPCLRLGSLRALLTASGTTC